MKSEINNQQVIKKPKIKIGTKLEEIYHFFRTNKNEYLRARDFLKHIDSDYIKIHYNIKELYKRGLLIRKKKEINITRFNTIKKSIYFYKYKEFE